MSKTDVAHIIESLGSEAIQNAIGVSRHAVRHCKWTGVFPATWYAVLDAMCAEQGIPCPRSCFAFKSNDDQPPEAVAS